MAYCTHCRTQGVGSNVAWKGRLANYKSHIRKRVHSCRIVSHFIGYCEVPSLNNLRFTLVDCLNNVGSSSKEDIDALLLQKERFWIGTVVTHHQGLNGKHDWNRKNRRDKER